MDRVLQDMPALSFAIGSIREIFTAAELVSLRDRDILSNKLLDKLREVIGLLAAYLFEDHLIEEKRPRGQRVRDAFLFRYALCAYSLVIVSSGGPIRTNPAKLRNDMVDVNFVTFATYFDDFLTADGQAAAIYDYAKFLLREVFAMSPWWL